MTNIKLNCILDEPYEDSGSKYVPSDSENQIPGIETNFRPKKRRRNIKSWKRNVAKEKRLKGEKFINSTGKEVPPKLFHPVTCSCASQCHLKIGFDRQEALFKNFYSLESYDLQTSNIYSFVDVAQKLRCYKKDGNPSRRSNTRLYFLANENGEKTHVCKTFFKLVLKSIRRKN